MADKSKMTVAEILAAARKADAKGGAADRRQRESAPAKPPERRQPADRDADPRQRRAKKPRRRHGRASPR